MISKNGQIQDGIMFHISRKANLILLKKLS